jgi:hypothetical protein
MIRRSGGDAAGLELRDLVSSVRSSLSIDSDISLLRDKRRERLDVSVPEGANSPSIARRGVTQHDLGNLQIVAITAFA